MARLSSGLQINAVIVVSYELDALDTIDEMKK
jgi:hypothetical protein